MSELFINKAKACSVSGHRALEKDFDKENLKSVFNKLIDIGFDTFLIGMAVGFDTLCFKTLYEIRKERGIKLIACIPCRRQDLKFNAYQKKEYDEMLSLADEKIILSEEYDKRCMQRRNEYLVEHSSVLVAYLRRDYGGTANTVNIAAKKGITIIKV